jgi:hypothetical protein
MWQTSLVVFHTYIYINNYCDISGIKLLKASEARIANDDSGVLIDKRTIIPSTRWDVVIAIMGVASHAQEVMNNDP